MSEPDSNTVQKLNKAFMDANSGEDKKETALMMISSSINWADFLTPAPMCIALLGQLMLISTEKDFSLEKQRPRMVLSISSTPNHSVHRWCKLVTQAGEHSMKPTR